jgi:2-keto-4-pentenoate hydratase/2-oxohepta-3-ene-1,7-dioic acid hydratase in catechol pathway
MRLANLNGRAAILADDEHAVDVASASDGTFGPELHAIFERWDEFCAWAATVDGEGGLAFSSRDLRAPSPAARQIFGIGMNYGTHADELGIARPERPPVFTKFLSSIAGPYDVIEHPGGDVDWEVELVAVIGRRGHRIAAESGWAYVAGVTVGLDLSERRLQLEGNQPQFSLGKSYPGFGPIGPFLVTPDELPDRDDLALGCLVNGELVQSDSTKNLLFSVPQLVAVLSAVTPLLPGDLIFTGTPGGMGMQLTPPRYLAAGDEVVGYVRGVGEVRNPIVAASSANAADSPRATGSVDAR